jgi:hypothetical protein
MAEGTTRFPWGATRIPGLETHRAPPLLFQFRFLVGVDGMVVQPVEDQFRHGEGIAQHRAEDDQRIGGGEDSDGSPHGEQQAPAEAGRSWYQRAQNLISAGKTGW